MSNDLPPSLDIEAPDGRRVILRPVVPLHRIPVVRGATLGTVVVIAAVWLFTGINRLNHTDLWGHLSLGRWIAEHHGLPHSHPFLFEQKPEPMIDSPWLAQVLGYLDYRLFGAEGLVLGHATLAALAVGLAIAAVRGRGVPLAWAAAMGATTYVLAIPIVGTIRPQLFAMPAFAAVLWAAARLPVRRTALMAIPVIFVLWANLHGSFPMGVAALGCVAVGTSIEKCRRGRSMAALTQSRAIRRVWLAVLLAVAACCVNPYGPRLLANVATFGENGNLRDLTEWHATTIVSLTGSLILISALLTAILLRYSPRRITAIEILLFLVFGLASLTAIRMLVWWAIVWPWIVAPHAAAVGRRLLAGRPLWGEENPPSQFAHIRTLLIPVVIVAALATSPALVALVSRHPRPAPVIFSGDTPYVIAHELAEHQFKGRIFTPMDWADYLIWQTHGGVEPLVSLYVHLAPTQVWEDSREIESGSPHWLTLADKYHLEFLVLSRARNAALLERVQHEPRCRWLYDDPQAVLIQILPGEKK